MNRSCQAVCLSIFYHPTVAVKKKGKEHPIQAKTWYKACPNVNQCKAL